MSLIKQHTVKSYDKELDSVSSTLDEMLDLVIQSLDMIVKMIKSKDESILEEIRRHDYKINALDSLIEKKITAMLALRQPMAVDLRFIISSLKVSSNLERSGDQAKSIIKKIVRVGDEGFDKKVEKELLSMIELCKEMTKKSIKAFNEQKLKLSEQVLKDDDKIDEAYKNFFKIIDEGTFDKAEVKKITNTLFIAKSFERLADHATNIAEITEFVITGESKN